MFHAAAVCDDESSADSIVAATKTVDVCLSARLTNLQKKLLINVTFYSEVVSSFAFSFIVCLSVERVQMIYLDPFKGCIGIPGQANYLQRGKGCQGGGCQQSMLNLPIPVHGGIIRLIQSVCPFGLQAGRLDV